MKWSTKAVHAVGLYWFHEDPLEQPPDEIRRSLLRGAPPGVRMEQVKALADRHDFSEGLSSSPESCEDNGRNREVIAAPVAAGMRSLVARVSRYDSQQRRPSLVFVCWQFDQLGHLEDVLVVKGIETGTIF